MMEEYKENYEETIKENTNEYEKQLLLHQGKQSYMTKEKFVEMISNLDFKAIERADLHFITGITLSVDRDNKPTIKTYGYDFEIR